MLENKWVTCKKKNLQHFVKMVINNPTFQLGEWKKSPNNGWPPFLTIEEVAEPCEKWQKLPNMVVDQKEIGNIIVEKRKNESSGSGSNWR